MYEGLTYKLYLPRSCAEVVLAYGMPMQPGSKGHCFEGMPYLTPITDF